MQFRDLSEAEKLSYSLAIIRQREIVRAAYSKFNNEGSMDAVNSIILKRVKNPSFVNPPMKNVDKVFIEEAQIYLASTGDKAPTTKEIFETNTSSFIMKRDKYLSSIKDDYDKAQKTYKDATKEEVASKKECLKAEKSAKNANSKKRRHNFISIAVKVAVVGFIIASLASLNVISAYFLSLTFAKIAVGVLSTILGFTLGKKYLYEPIKMVYNTRKKSLTDEATGAEKTAKEKESAHMTKVAEKEKAKEDFDLSKQKYTTESSAISSIDTKDDAFALNYSACEQKLEEIANRNIQLINTMSYPDSEKTQRIAYVNGCLDRFKAELINTLRVYGVDSDKLFDPDPAGTSLLWDNPLGSICARANRVMEHFASGLLGTLNEDSKKVAKGREKFLQDEEILP